MHKFICLDCGSQQFSGSASGIFEIEIDKEGNIKIIDTEWVDFELICDECDGTDNIERIGKY